MEKAGGAKVRRGMFVAVGPLVSRMREVKDAGEIARMRAAARVGCELFEGLLSYLEAGLTETEVAATLEYAARLAGAEGMSFDTIVACGGRWALPPGRASAAELPERGFGTVDFGVMLDGDGSGMLRTVHIGKAVP